MLKVAFLTQSLHIGGAEQWILTLGEAFQNARAHCIIHTTPFDHPQVVARAERLCPVERPTQYGPLIVKRCIDEACRDADVVISWGHSNLEYLTQDLDIPVIEVSHSSAEWDDQTKLVHQSIKGADFGVAVSQTAATSFPADKRAGCFTIYSGASLERSTPHFGRDWQRRTKWGMGKSDKVALFLGRLAEVKGPTRLIKAMGHLDENWHAIFYGHGDARYTEQCHDLAKLVAPGRCIFLPPQFHVGDLLAGADCLVMPSDCEGMPMAMIEAWQAGLPVVTTRYGWVDEVEKLAADHGYEYPPFMVTTTSPEDIAGAIAVTGMSCGEDSLKDRMEPIKTGLRLSSDLFTASAMAARWESFIHFAVAQKREMDIGD